ncbi:hypothetical protein [Paenibacillus aestuarii]|uniref:Uncharacterized protein n=1 Tax=Paenibacillus aestuarii TaxID=516965 RepID=A0ABW0K3P7_9BACL|nr:hypothetical protein [Paenibacillus aestuarii]
MSLERVPKRRKCCSPDLPNCSADGSVASAVSGETGTAARNLRGKRGSARVSQPLQDAPLPV